MCNTGEARRRGGRHSSSRRRDSAEEPCPLFRYRVVELAEVLDDDSQVTVDEGYSRKQFINLERSGYRGRGRFVRLKARIERVAGAGTLRGRTVYWRFAPGGGARSHLSEDYYDRLPNGMKAGFGGEGGASTTTSTTDRDGWSRPVDFYLSQYGGDELTVRASQEETGDSRSAGTYQVWRKVFVEIETMHKTGSGYFGDDFNLTALTDYYDTLFIEIQRIERDSHPLTVRMLRVEEVASWAAELRDEDSRVEARRGRYVQIAFLDTIGADPETAEYDFWLDGAQGTSTADMERPFPEQVLLDERRDDWLVGAWVRQSAVPWRRVGDGGRRFGVRWDESADRFQLVIRQHGLDGLGLTLTNRVYFKLRVRQYEGLGGLQVPGPCAAICTRWTFAAVLADRRTYLQNTVLHETGHAFGLAATRHPDNAAIPMPTETYRRFGLHCHINGDTCIMFQRIELPNTQFCDNCRQALLAREFTRLPRDGGERFR